MLKTKTISTTTLCDKEGKVLGTLELFKYPTVPGYAGARIIAENGDKVQIVKFQKKDSKWINDWSPSISSNKDRMNLAINCFYATPEYVSFLANLSSYESHSI